MYHLKSPREKSTWPNCRYNGRAWKELKGQTIGITHGDDLETAEALKALITDRFGCEVFIVNTIGAAIGAYRTGCYNVIFLK